MFFFYIIYKGQPAPSRTDKFVLVDPSLYTTALYGVTFHILDFYFTYVTITLVKEVRKPLFSNANLASDSLRKRGQHLFCGCSSMVELQPSKLVAWVRFPSPAP